jgi:hypothetical protein
LLYQHGQLDDVRCSLALFLSRASARSLSTHQTLLPL